jgi:hypothetical protein
MIQRSITILSLFILCIQFARGCEDPKEKYENPPETQNYLYEYLKGAELQCEDVQEAEISHVLNDLLNLPAAELRKKRYKNYQGHPGKWTAPYFIERHFVPEEMKGVNEDTFYEDLKDPRVKEIIRSLLKQYKLE